MRLFYQNELSSELKLNRSQGIFYFLSHRSLQKPLTSKLVPTLSMGLAIVVGMFVLTYLPQVAVMALFEGPLAPFSTGLLVLNESSTLFNALSRYLLIEDALVDVFDGVLLEKGVDGLVAEGREVQKGKMQKMGDSMDRLGKSKSKLPLLSLRGQTGQIGVWDPCSTGSFLPPGAKYWNPFGIDQSDNLPAGKLCSATLQSPRLGSLAILSRNSL